MEVPAGRGNFGDTGGERGRVQVGGGIRDPVQKVQEEGRELLVPVATRGGEPLEEFDVKDINAGEMVADLLDKGRIAYAADGIREAPATQGGAVGDRGEHGGLVYPPA